MIECFLAIFLAIALLTLLALILFWGGYSNPRVRMLCGRLPKLDAWMRGQVIQRCSDIVQEARALRHADPQQASDDFSDVIEQLTALQPWLEPERASCATALGQAFLDRCLIRIAQGSFDEGMADFEKAKSFIKVNMADIRPHLAAAYLAHGDTSEDAVLSYIHFLRLPGADAQSAQRMAALLRQHARITEDMSADDVLVKMRLNLSLAAVPGPGTRLVVEKGNTSGAQFVVNRRMVIGSDTSADIRLDDPNVAKQHACIDVAEGGCVIWDAGSASGTLVQGQKIETALRLSDGDRVQCGNAVLGFYSKARPLGGELVWAHYNLGIGYLKLGHYWHATVEFNKARSLGIETAELHWYLGRAHEMRKHWQKASKEFDAALSIDETYHLAHGAKGQILLSCIDQKVVDTSRIPDGAIKDSIAHLERATILAPDHHEYFCALARVYGLAGKKNETIAAFQSAIALKPDDIEYRILLARFAHKTGVRDVTKREVVAVLNIQPGHVEANWILGDLAFDETEYATAAERLEYVRRAETRKGGQGFSNNPDFAFRLGRSLFEVGKYQEASRALSPVAKQSRRAMFYAGRCHSCTGHFESAARIFQRTLSTFGEDPEARFYLAATLGNVGSNYAEALDIAAPLENHEEWEWRPRGLCLSGRLLLASGQLDAAAEKFEKARALSPEDRSADFELGRVAFLRGDLERAASAFQSVLDHSPDDFRSLVWLGRTQFALGCYDDAASCLDRAIQKPTFTGLSEREGQTLLNDAHCLRGSTARIHGDHPRAVQQFEAARANGHIENRTAYELALSYAETGNLQESLATLSSLAGDDEVDKGIVTRNMAVVACRLAGKYFEAHRYDAASPLFQQSYGWFQECGASRESDEVRKALAESRFRCGVQALFSKKNRRAQAISELQQAYQLNEKDGRAAYFLGVAHFRDGNYGKASESFHRLVDSGQRDQHTVAALAIALEQAGNETDAEATWRSLAETDGDNHESRIHGKLGMAGFYVRRKQWDRTAALLREVLSEQEISQHPAYADLCKLAVSYCSLAGDNSAVEEIVHQHLSGAAPDSAEAYLGAICVQKNSLPEALDHLQRAIQSHCATDAVLELYDQVARGVAAQRVLAGHLEEAAAILNGITALCKKMSTESRKFLSDVQAALVLGSAGGDIGEGAAAAYEKALRSQPHHSKILRNYAILCHRLAISLEEQDDVRKADRYWKRACERWNQILTGTNGFWESYIDSYNEHRHRRDRVGTEEKDVVCQRLIDRFGAIHVEFAKSYLASGRMSEVKRHVTYATTIDPSGTAGSQMMKPLLETARELKTKGQEAEFLSFCELGYQMCPADKEIRASYATAVFNRGTERKLKEDFSGAENDYSTALELDPKVLENEAARTMYVDLYVSWAVAKIRSGSESAAERCYRKARDRVPNLESDSKTRPIAAAYYLALGNAAAGRGERWSTKSHLEKALSLDPTLFFKVDGLREACAALGIAPPVGGAMQDLLRALLNR